MRVACACWDECRPGVARAHNWLVAHPAINLSDHASLPLLATLQVTEVGTHSAVAIAEPAGTTENEGDGGSGGRTPSGHFLTAAVSPPSAHCVRAAEHAPFRRCSIGRTTVQKAVSSDGGARACHPAREAHPLVKA